MSKDPEDQRQDEGDALFGKLLVFVPVAIGLAFVVGYIVMPYFFPGWGGR